MSNNQSNTGSGNQNKPTTPNQGAAHQGNHPNKPQTAKPAATKPATPHQQPK